MFRKIKAVKVKVKRSGKSRIDPGCAQHIGLRREQQDSFGFSDFKDEELVENTGVLAVLADGMGGMDLGKEASAAAVKTMLEVFSNKSLTESAPQVLIRAAGISNSVVRDIADIRGTGVRVGTTLLAAVVSGSGLFWLSVGDSRIYAYREGALEQLTEDHIYERELEEEVLSGRMTKEEAAAHPEKDHLISYIGIEKLELVGRNTESFSLGYGDMILLCSDGLYRALSDNEIAAVMGKYRHDPQAAAEQLVNNTIRKRLDYQDNVTVVILKYDRYIHFI